MDIFSNLFVFLLATFLGLDVIRRVSPLLHTPLMSLTNAISAISLVGAILVLGEQTGPDQNLLVVVLAAIAVAAAMTNVVSGFLITDRMLKMFKRREPAGCCGRAGAPDRPDGHDDAGRCLAADSPVHAGLRTWCPRASSSCR